MNYSYWEDFFQKWFNEDTHWTWPVNDWKHPNIIPVLNYNNCPRTFPDYSFEYIPEPWWGNDGSAPLDCVVMNYNPGAGDIHQYYTNLRDLSKGQKSISYSDITKHSAFCKTTHWHLEKRAEPILSVLNKMGHIPPSSVCLASYLGVEILPWHTTDTSNSLGYQTYVSQNLIPILENSFSFAAEQSKRIRNGKMDNKVIIKMAWNVLNNNILGPVTAIYSLGVGYNIITPPTSIGTGNYCVFEFTFLPTCTLKPIAIKQLKGVKFVCIWGPQRNNLPVAATLNSIFNLI